jgi:adenine-specific DNA-methyltransferase
MSQKYEKLKSLLKELFQLDQPDLDFGLYRIMHAKAGEVTQFLDKDLLPQVKQAFACTRRPTRPRSKRNWPKSWPASRRRDGPRAIAQGSGTARQAGQRGRRFGRLENEVYDYLYSFFRRYYSDGDFLAKRVYKPGVYAIPYEGEEVKLHWANRDQYYIKTSEYLRDYAFRLHPDNEDNPRRVHFRLVDAAEGEHGNVKPAEGKDRVFILAPDGESGRDFIAEEPGTQGNELCIRFEYRPAQVADWPEESREGKTKPPTQKELIASAVQRILNLSHTPLAGRRAGPSGRGQLPSPSGRGVGVRVTASWLTELQPHVKADGERADYSRLEAHLRRYTARNTFDYFIHKDLGGFLRRELDFYIKNEVMHLDDIESETAPRVEQYLSKIKVIRRIAGKIIDFLAQLEDFQKSSG